MPSLQLKQNADKVLEKLILADITCSMRGNWMEINPSPELKASLSNQSRIVAPSRPSDRARPAYRL
jgi:hypothetical protein